MGNNFTRISFEKHFNVERIITLFYMEMSKSFHYDGESHDFWEMVYIDKGQMLCTADKNRFLLKSGEMTFHKPNEFHNLSGDNQPSPNVSILTFQCKSRAMKHFEGKIFRLSPEEKSILARLFEEGIATYRLLDESDPLLQNMEQLDNAPFGSSQMVKNLLEIFLIMLCRNTDVVTKRMRRSYVIDGVDVPYHVKEILDYLQNNLYGRITISDVAHKLGKSESTVKQIFAGYRKEGLIHYYNNLKIREARKLIRQGRYNFAQIADLLCFDSPQYFSKCFKKCTQMTPREYKASIRK
jgi:AraC-like DNA-binding protein